MLTWGTSASNSQQNTGGPFLTASHHDDITVTDLISRLIRQGQAEEHWNLTPANKHANTFHRMPKLTKAIATLEVAQETERNQSSQLISRIDPLCQSTKHVMGSDEGHMSGSVSVCHGPVISFEITRATWFALWVNYSVPFAHLFFSPECWYVSRRESKSKEILCASLPNESVVNIDLQRAL